MMHFKSLFAILILVVGFSFSLAAQKNYTEEADNAFTMRRYYEAVELYQKAYSDVTNKVERRRILFQIAECYRLTNNIRRAEFAYLRAIRTDYPDPEIYLRYANILMKREKYEDALEQFRKYKEEVPDDPRADIGIESCKMAPDWMENPTRYEVEANRRINDRNSDFAPMYADRNYKTVVFASTRSEATGKTDPNTGQRFSDLFIIERDERGNFSRAELLDDEGIINTGENVGAVDFDRRFTTMYFTKCPTERKEVLTCRIYSTRKRGRTWSEPEMLKLGPDTFTYGHPAVSSDERTIIFASDMDGGEGELDLWMATRRSANRPFGEPENLGPAINTHGNEMYPYLFDDNTLYFSSNGHVGMGGLDIFVSKKENGEWGEPENMKYPMNSPLDDFGITFNKNQRTLEENEAEQMGFLTTSRRGGRGSDNLWHFRLPEIVFTISGVVRNESNLQRMPGATVTMEGSDGTKVETKTDNTGRYNFNERQVNKNTSYELIASMEGFFDDTKKETTVGRETSADLVVDFRLKPIPDEPIPLPEIRFDLAKWDLKDKYKDSLNGLIKTLEKNPKLVIELAAHTDFRDTKEKNDTLSLRRAQSIVDYLVDEGIDRRRLRPRGYGERRPRKLRKELTVNGVSFEKGTHLTESYIKDLRTSREKEAAHQLNRRVTFEILRNDFVPSKDAVADIDTTGFGDIELNPEENILELKVTDNNYEMPVIVNRQQLNARYEKNSDAIYLSFDKAMELLNEEIITVSDFSEGAEAIDDEQGTIVEDAEVIMSNVRIANKRLEDVAMIVKKEQKPDIVIGDEGLKKFGSFTIDEEGDRLIFGDTSTSSPQED